MVSILIVQDQYIFRAIRAVLCLRKYEQKQIHLLLKEGIDFYVKSISHTMLRFGYYNLM